VPEGALWKIRKLLFIMPGHPKIFIWNALGPKITYRPTDQKHRHSGPSRRQAGRQDKGQIKLLKPGATTFPDNNLRSAFFKVFFSLRLLGYFGTRVGAFGCRGLKKSGPGQKFNKITQTIKSKVKEILKEILRSTIKSTIIRHE